MDPAALDNQIMIAIAKGRWAEAEVLSKVIDAFNPAAESNLLGAALWYAEQGLRVFPCKSHSKRPATLNGFHSATDWPVALHDWWSENPNYNIGIATGHLIDVIDVDPAGLEKWAGWISSRDYISRGSAGDCCILCGKVAIRLPTEHDCELNKYRVSDSDIDALTVVPDLPPILGVASTRRPGGTHYYVPASGLPTDPGDPNSNHSGIDFKRIGGYVIAPPSVVALEPHEVPESLRWEGPARLIHYRWRRPLDLSTWQNRLTAEAASS